MLKVIKAKFQFLLFCQLFFSLNQILCAINAFAVFRFAAGNDLLFYTGTNSFELSTPLPTKVHTPCRALCGVASEWPQPWQGLSSLRNWGLEAALTVTQAGLPLHWQGWTSSACVCVCSPLVWCPALLRICLFAGVPLSTWVVRSWWWDKGRGEGHSCWTLAPSKYTLTLLNFE